MSLSSQTNSSYYTYYSVDDFYPTILGILGFALNTLSFVALCKSVEFNKRPNASLYFYMKVYSLTNAFLSFISIFTFVGCSYRLYSWSNCLPTQIYYSIVLGISSSLMCMYASILEIVIILERITYFKIQLKKLFVISGPRVCLLSFLVCLIVDAPFYFIYIVDSRTFKLNLTATFTIWFTSTSDYASSLVGKVLLYICYALKDVGIVLIQIFLSLLWLCLFRGYLINRQKF
jgi:hypothetical protein